MGGVLAQRLSQTAHQGVLRTFLQEQLLHVADQRGRTGEVLQFYLEEESDYLQEVGDFYGEVAVVAVEGEEGVECVEGRREDLEVALLVGGEEEEDVGQGVGAGGVVV